MFNYTNPFRKYFYSISNGLFEESYTTNHLNFNPSKLISHEGIFFTYIKEALSYLFDLKEKINTSSGNSGIYVAYYFWMQRKMQYYERVYPKIQVLLSNVGGLCSIVLISAELINYIVNQYIILFDMNNYMNEIEKSKEYDKIFAKSKVNNKFEIDINNKLFPPKKVKPNKLGLLKSGINIFNKNPKFFKKNKSQKNPVCINNSSLNKNNNLIHANNLILSNEVTGRNPLASLSHKYLNNLIKEKLDSQSNISLKEKTNKNILFNKVTKNNIDINDSKNENNETLNYNKLKFCHYLSYLISLKKLHTNINLYSEFRIKMISEENLIFTKLKMDKLLNNYKKENSIIHQELVGTQNVN